MKKKVWNQDTLEDVEAILFDFDGTLAPNLDLVGMRQSIIDYSLECGVPSEVFADQYIVEIIDASSDWLAKNPQVINAIDYARCANKIVVDFEMDSAAKTKPFNGVRQMLSELIERGVKSGVVTRNCREAVLQTFPDLLSYVNSLHARDDVEHIKPDPRHLNASLMSLGVTPESTLMVGDGALDMRVGKQLGLYCVGVLSGSGGRDDLQLAGADVVIADCLDLT